MSPIDAAGGTGIIATAPRRVFFSHTSDLGKHTEPGTFVADAVEAALRARHAVTDMAYFAARAAAPVRYRPDLSCTELEFEAGGERGQARRIPSDGKPPAR